MYVLRMTFLVVASATLLLTVWGMLSSRRYETLVQNLDAKQYPLCELYGLGFFLSSLPVFALRGSLENNLKRQSRLYWDSIYAEYYAELTWAEFLTFTCLILGFGCGFASLFGDMTCILVAVFSVLCIAAAWNLIIDKMKEAVQKRTEECIYEFPDMVVKLALLVNSGMVSREAWYTVAYSKDVPLYQLMQRACEEMDNGMTEGEAIHKFGVLTDSDDIKKFTSSMIQSFERGGSDLATFLMGQAGELLAHKRQLSLQRGEAAAAKLIIPIAAMFAGVIVIILGAVMQSMSLSF